MFCGKCGSKMNNGICSNCSSNQQNRLSIKNKKAIISIVGLIVLILVVIFIIIFSGENKRSNTLTSLDKNDYLKFNLDGTDFYLGDMVSTYKDKNYIYDTTYLSDNAYVNSDSIVSQTFYNGDGDAQFLGALYCRDGVNCSYDDTVVVKINFYEKSNVIVNDYIKFGMDYDDIVEKYGKEDGKFYQDDDLLVWSFGVKGKIGEPYYILRFDHGGLFSTGDLIEIRIGVWWYEGEYEHTVIKENSEVWSE